MEQAKDVKPEDMKEVRRPGFRHFMEVKTLRKIVLKRYSNEDSS